MQFPACLHIVNALSFVDAVIPQKRHCQFVNLGALHLRPDKRVLIDFSESRLEHVFGFSLVSHSCAFPERSSVTVILNPPNRRAVTLIYAAASVLAFHFSSCFFALAQRADTAVRAISLRFLGDTLL